MAYKEMVTDIFTHGDTSAGDMIRYHGQSPDTKSAK